MSGLKNRVYRSCVAASAAEQNLASTHQIKFLFSKLQDLIPTNDDCYLSACNGSFCIIDRYRPAVAGSRVLIEVAGDCNWAYVRRHPEQIITDEGVIIEGKALSEVTIIGVAIREIIPTSQRSSL
ncbi:hypothetical protein ACMGGR_19530 [Erwinia sp. BNK-24-b]|uniref:hypothetical protein n=1 Tax=unclassified Erwinia TaxID=2622719 RepID=UPI0039BEFE51